MRRREERFARFCRPRRGWVSQVFSSRVKTEIKKDSGSLGPYRSLLSFVVILLLIIVPLKILSGFDFFRFGELEEKIKNQTQAALNNLFAAADSINRWDLSGADSNFQAASADFLAAQEELGKINDAILSLASLAGNPEVKMAAESKKFLTAGALASSLGRNLVLATDSLFKADFGKDSFEKISALEPIAAESNEAKFIKNENNFSDSLDQFLLYGRAAVKDARELEKVIVKIDSDNLPSAYREKFDFLSQGSAALADNLDNFVSAGDKLKEILGLSRDKRYLLVFQNNAELRASGGFLGSYALVDLRDGKIRNLEVPGGGSYDTEAGLKSIRVAAPEPLWLVNPLWHFWDANWWPDWPTTAKNLMWFYEKSDGPSVDGVIGLTPTVVEGLLEISGPIDLTAEYDIVIDADNFWETVQMVTEKDNLAKSHPELAAGLNVTQSELPEKRDIAESGYSGGLEIDLPDGSKTNLFNVLENELPDKIATDLPLEQGLEINSENKPKKIIGDLMVKILEILPQKLSPENLLKIVSIFEKNMAEKQILFYFSDPALRAEMSERNWAGEVKDTAGDYLMVVNTNIAGQKTDRVIDDEIKLVSEVDVDGVIINTLSITRTHRGVKNEPLTGVRNVDWLRVYVPAGSKLLSSAGWRAPDPEYLLERPEDSWEEIPLLAAERAAETDSDSGTRIYSENGKTVFANWLMLDPGGSETVILKYRLPFNFFALESDKERSWAERINNWLNPENGKLYPYSLLAQKQPGAKPAGFSSRLYFPDDQEIFWRHPEDLKGEDGWDINTDLDSDKYWVILLKD
jgi:hypothetical protein